MRSATIIDTISRESIASLEPPELSKVSEFPPGGILEVGSPTDAVRSFLMQYVERVADCSAAQLCCWYTTSWLGPHTDDVIGDVTIGVVAEGNHWLFTGSGRKVGKLVPGSVFLLNNKRVHGAMQIDAASPTPLLFAAVDVCTHYGAAYRSLSRAV